VSVFFRGIALAAKALLPILTHFSRAWSDGLSDVCIFVTFGPLPPCLDHLVGLDAIWPVHLWSPVTDYVSWGFDHLTSSGGEICRSLCNNVQLSIATKPSVLCCCYLSKYDSAFCHITWVLVVDAGKL